MSLSIACASAQFYHKTISTITMRKLNPTHAMPCPQNPLTNRAIMPGHQYHQHRPIQAICIYSPLSFPCLGSKFPFPSPLLFFYYSLCHYQTMEGQDGCDRTLFLVLASLVFPVLHMIKKRITPSQPSQGQQETAERWSGEHAVATKGDTHGNPAQAHLKGPLLFARNQARNRISAGFASSEGCNEIGPK